MCSYQGYLNLIPFSIRFIHTSVQSKYSKKILEKYFETDHFKLCIQFRVMKNKSISLECGIFLIIYHPNISYDQWFVLKLNLKESCNSWNILLSESQLGNYQFHILLSHSHQSTINICFILFLV